MGGDWEVTKWTVNGPLRVVDGNSTVAIIQPQNMRIAKANARLIAAAPDMFNALIGILEHVYNRDDPSVAAAVKAVTNALIKANGGEPIGALAKARGE